MELVALVLTSHVVTDLGAVDETKGESVLLTDLDTLRQRGGTVTLLELIGIGVGLNGGLQLLSREHREVQNVVGVEVSSLSALGLLRDGGDTIPSDTLAVGLLSRVVHIQCAVVDTSLNTALTSLVPDKCSHVNS